MIRRPATLVALLCTAGTAQDAPRPADLIPALLRGDGLGPTCDGPVAEAKDGARWRQGARGYGIDR